MNKSLRFLHRVSTISRPRRVSPPNTCYRASFALPALALLAGVALLPVPAAKAATYNYTRTTSNTAGTADQWLSGTNWDAIPLSAPDTTLNFSGTLAAGATIFTNNDNAGNFQLNLLNFTYAGPASGTAPTVTISGNPLEFVNNGATTPVLNIAATGTVVPVLTISNNVVLTNNLSITGSSNATMSGVISGASNLSKSLAGTLTLTGTNTYTGTTTVSGTATASVTGSGTLQIGNGVTDGSILTTSNIVLSGGALVFNLVGNSTYSTVISNLGQISKTGAGTLTLTGSNNFTGTTTAFGGSSSNTVQAGFQISGGTVSVGSIGSISGMINDGVTTAATVGSNLGGAYTFIYFANNGVLQYTGGGETTDRRVFLGGNAGGAVIDQSGTGLLKFTGNVDPDSGNGNANQHTLTLQGSTSGAGEFAGAIVNNGNNRPISLTKAGTSTWTLSGANTYTGTTKVNGGNLRLKNALGTSTTASGTGTGAVTLSGGTTTTVSGTGNALGLLTATNGSRIAPGINVSGANTNFGMAGTLTLGTNSTGTTTNGLTLTSANLDYDLASTAAGTSDLVKTGGALTLGTVVFTFNELTTGSLDTATTYTLISGASSETGPLSGVSGTVIQGDYTPSFSFGGTNNSDLLVSFSPIAVPEPGTWVGGMLLVGFLGYRLRRRVSHVLGR